MIKTFEESGLDQKILNAIADLGFQTPTDIQSKTIPHLLNSSKDLIALAQTGTGKTAAFGLPLIQLADHNLRSIQAIILCPTRELCIQITKDIERFTKYYKELRSIAVYGGASIDTQIRAIRDGVHIVVGTPGRVNDLIRRRVLNLNDIRWVVLDEADEMLNMGFKEEIDTILEETPKERQTLLFSATMPDGIVSISRNYMTSPDTITSGTKNTGTENVAHEYYLVNAKHRYLALKRIADLNPNIYAIIFCRTRRETQEIADKLMHDGYSADSLHGDLSQGQRDYVMDRFRNRSLQMLVATDVAARGLDVTELTHVINYSLPDDIEVYIHRSGRTGRAGKTGICVSIVHTKEVHYIRELERKIKREFLRKMVPNGFEVCEKQLFNLIDKVHNVEINEVQIEGFLESIYEKFADTERNELIKRFVSMEFNRFLEYYQDAEDINIDTTERKVRRPGGGGLTKFYINIGSKVGLTKSMLIQLIVEKTRDKRIEIGKIDVMQKCSYFEVDSNSDRSIYEGFRNAKFKGISIVVEAPKPTMPGNSDDQPSGNDFRGPGARRANFSRGGNNGGGGFSGGPRGGGDSRNRRPDRRF